MCNKDRCLFCIPVEHGCLAFGILSAIVSGLGLLGSITTGILFYLEIILVLHSDDSYPGDAQAAVSDSVARVVIWFAVVMGTVGFLIAFIFSVLLCNGICKRRPEQVNAYKNYGLNITVLTVLASVISLFIADSYVPGLLGLLGCALYSLFLELVHRTYEKLRTDAVFKDHARLMEGPI